MSGESAIRALARYAKPLEDLCQPIWFFDIDHSQVIWSNRAASQLWNANSQAELYARDMSEDMSPAVGRRLKQYQEDFTQGMTFSEHWTLYPNGRPATHLIVFSGHTLADGRVVMRCEAVDQSANDDSTTLRGIHALMHTSVMISLYGSDECLCYCNPAARESMSNTRRTLSQHFVHREDYQDVLAALAEHDEYTTEKLVNTNNGPTWHELNFQKSPDAVSGEQAILLSESDISVRRQVEWQIQELAYRDVLTGLYNRTYLMDRIESEICRAIFESSPFAVLFFDMDRFKNVNDTLGHRIGDELLKQTASIIRSNVYESDVVVRLGGDEFLILLSEGSDQGAASVVAQRMLAVFDEPVHCDQHEIAITPSIGISVFPENGDTVEELLQAADIAMYKSKAEGGNCFKYFDAGMRDTFKDRLQLEIELKRAIKENQFELFYQPRVSAHTHEITSVEALIRWNHPDRGLLSPAVFIQLAEETGLINPIGDWVLQEGARQCARWAQQGWDMGVSINISTRQFGSNRLPMRVRAVLEETACPPEKLELEITESMLVRETTSVARMMDDLHSTGVRIAIDDFGTGYSNLAYLHSFSIDCLKIDRAFVKNIEQPAILKMIINLGKSLGVKLVAEGVETIDEIEWLEAHACDELQGFYFSRPLPLAELDTLLNNQSGSRSWHG